VGETRSLVVNIKRTPLECHGSGISHWSYSNTGYVVLGILTSKLAGMHWSEFQKQRIFEPLEMTTARVICESDIVANPSGAESGGRGEHPPSPTPGRIPFRSMLQKEIASQL